MLAVVPESHAEAARATLARAGEAAEIVGAVESSPAPEPDVLVEYWS
jgi:hydrogenase maturation factor